MTALTRIHEGMTEGVALVVGGVAEFVAIVVAASHLSRVSATLVIVVVLAVAWREYALAGMRVELSKLRKLQPDENEAFPGAVGSMPARRM